MSVDFTNTPIGIYTGRVAELQGQQPRIFKIVLDVRRIKDLIIRLNTVEQLETEHVDSNNDALFSKVNQRGTYSKLTESLSGGAKRAGEQYTLKDTGEFYASFRVEVNQDEICIFADPFKEDTNLFDEYGKAILGLTQENLEILQIEAKALFQKWYKTSLNI